MPNDLNELLRFLADPAPVTGDLDAAASAVRDHLSHQLGLRLRTAAAARKQDAAAHPPREAVLLRALKPFAGSGAPALDQAAQLLTTISAYDRLRRDLAEAEKKARTPSGRSRYSYRSSAAEPTDAREPGDLARLLLTMAFLERL